MDTWSVINDPINRDCAPALTDSDLVIIQDVERALADGLQLKQWWEQKEATNSYTEQFELARTYNRAEQVKGFFDNAWLNGRSFPIMGLVQQMLFDQPKQVGPELVRNELREFVLHYFMRVSSFRQPEAYVSRDEYKKSDVRRALQPFSFCHRRTDPQVGFGYTQLYYKLRSSSYIGKFPVHLQQRVVDLREIGNTYEWIVLQVNIFDFNITYTPFADGPFSLVFPLREETYIAISRDFITHQDDPTPDLLGSYGFGYALLKPAPRRSIFAYGPGNFSAGFQTINFDVHRNGQSHARMTFVSNRPERVMSLELNPVTWGFRFADLMTLGLASRLFGPVKNALERVSPRIENFDPVTTYIAVVNLLTSGVARDQLCASLEALEKNPMLLTHFMEHYNMLAGALMTWRHVQDWLDRNEIPEGVLEGTTS